MKKYLLSELDGSICSTAYPLQEKDLKNGAAVMAAAFCDDPAIRYLLGGEDTGNDDWRYFNAILKSIHAKCVMLSTDNAINDLLILFPPQLKAVPTIGFLSNGGMNLYRPFGKGLFIRSMNYESNCRTVKDRFVTPEAWYCMCFVVLPEMQGQGLGSGLIKPVLNILDSKNIPLYLETHKPRNTQIYEHLGFDMVDTSVIPGTDISQYAMLRRPRR